MCGKTLAALTSPRWDKDEEQLAENLRVLESGAARAASRTHVAWVPAATGVTMPGRGSIESTAQWEKSKIPWERKKVPALIASLPEP